MSIDERSLGALALRRTLAKYLFYSSDWPHKVLLWYSKLSLCPFGFVKVRPSEIKFPRGSLLWAELETKGLLAACLLTHRRIRREMGN